MSGRHTRAGKAQREPAGTLLAQELLGARSGRQRVLRQAHFAEVQRQAAAAGDLHRVGERLGKVREQRRHLLRAAQILLMRVAARPTGIGEQRAVVDAHPRLVGVELGRGEEAHVVGGDHRHAAAAGERDRGGDIGFLERPPEALQLDIEAPGKQRQPGVERALGVAVARIHQRAAEITVARARKRDQPVERRATQPAALDARHAALLPLEVGTRDQPREIAVTALRLAQQREARGRLPLALLAQQQIDADQRLHARLERLAIELHHREQIVLVGHRDRRHARGGDRRDQLRHPHHAVAQRELGVQPQVNEALCHRRLGLVFPAGQRLLAADAHRTERAAMLRRGRARA